VSGPERLPSGEPPRSAEQPWALSSGEVFRGGLISWAVFTGAAPGAAILAFGLGNDPSSWGGFLASGLILVAIMAVLMYAVPISAAALIVLGFPLALLVDRLLRRSRSYPLHLLAAAGLGLLVGAGVSLGLTASLPFGPAFPWQYVAVLGPLTALASGTGWIVTMRRARRDDDARALWRAAPSAVAPREPRA